MPKQRIAAMRQSLEQTFPINIQTDSNSFEFYPISNEAEYWRLIENLENIQAPRTTSQLRVGILFGESNFLSMLPSLTKLVDVVLLADVEPRMHQHTQHMLNLFKQTDSPEQFVAEYSNSNAMDNVTLTGESTPGLKHLTERLFSKKSQTYASLKKYHFLHNQERYDACKQALDQLAVIQIKLDLTDMISCTQLANLLQIHQANFTLCNFTNIHHYVEPNKLRLTTSALLQESSEYLVMYALGLRHKLTTYFSIGLADYFADCLGFPKDIHNAPVNRNASRLLFFSQGKREQSPICFLAFTADCTGTVSQKTIKGIVSQCGEFNINDLSTLLHAFDSYDEAKQFALNILTKEKVDPIRENAYWIFTLEGASHELNPLLRYRDLNFQWQHYPLDMRGDGREIEARIIKVQNNTNTITFEKSPGSLLKKRVQTYFQEKERAEDTSCRIECSIQ